LDAIKDGELQVCKVEIKFYKARVEIVEAQIKMWMVAVDNGGSIQVSTSLKVNAPIPPTFNELGA